MPHVVPIPFLSRGGLVPDPVLTKGIFIFFFCITLEPRVE